MTSMQDILDAPTAEEAEALYIEEISIRGMGERGFTWYGPVDAGHWVFDARLRKPAVRAEQLDRAAEERKERCRELLKRRHCIPARQMKLLRRISGKRLGQRPSLQRGETGQLVVLNRRVRRAQAAGAAL